MAANLLKCVSQRDIDTPYRFSLTGINVYSFEEALYHVYNYWEQSMDDFVSDEFIGWVKNVLDLSFLAAKIKQIAAIKSLSARLIGFLLIIDYFDEVQIAGIRNKVIQWESALEWERLNKKADYLMQHKDPERAVAYYKKALTFSENKMLLNNIAIALMQLENFSEAEFYLSKAYAIDNSDIIIMLNLAEGAIYNHNYEKALRMLKNAEKLETHNPDIQYLYGELNLEAGNIRYSIDYFEKAYELNKDSYYLYRLADVYVKLRLFDKALSVLDRSENKDKVFLVKQSEVYALYNNIPAAIKCIEKALLLNKDDEALWTRLAKLYRMDYDLPRAGNAALTALGLMPSDERARLEDARIKKAQGKLKEYQHILHGILKDFKKKYRETTGV